MYRIYSTHAYFVTARYCKRHYPSRVTLNRCTLAYPRLFPSPASRKPHVAIYREHRLARHYCTSSVSVINVCHCVHASYTSTKALLISWCPYCSGVVAATDLMPDIAGFLAVQVLIQNTRRSVCSSQAINTERTVSVQGVLKVEWCRCQIAPA